MIDTCVKSLSVKFLPPILLSLLFFALFSLSFPFSFAIYLLKKESHCPVVFHSLDFADHFSCALIYRVLWFTLLSLNCCLVLDWTHTQSQVQLFGPTVKAILCTTAKCRIRPFCLCFPDIRSHWWSLPKSIRPFGVAKWQCPNFVVLPSLINKWKWKWRSLSRVWLFATPLTVQSMEFSRPEYWSG